MHPVSPHLGPRENAKSTLIDARRDAFGVQCISQFVLQSPLVSRDRKQDPSTDLSPVLYPLQHQCYRKKLGV